MQVPTFPAAAQVWQVPVQALLQQTPSAQKVDAQSAPVWQACPICAVGVVGRSTVPPESVPGWTTPMSFLCPAAVGVHLVSGAAATAAHDREHQAREDDRCQDRRLDRRGDTGRLERAHPRLGETYGHWACLSD